MSSLGALLESYRTDAISERDKGAAFEKLIAAWLVKDPVQSKRFARVDPWFSWAHQQKLNRTDTGIDLVGTLYNGDSVAVQCKFYDADRSIKKRDIDSFISASAKHSFSERLIVETTNTPWSPNAQEMLRGQTIPTVVIGLQNLHESQVDWSEFEATGKIVRLKPKPLRTDQVKALEAVQAGLAKANRGKLIMACGTGKTLTSLRIAEKLAGTSNHVLFLVPSLTLMAQTIREWCTNTLLPLTAFAVCSDTQVGRRRSHKDDIAELEVTDLAFPATTDAALLTPKVANSDADSMRVIFATYQSISVIEAAQKDHNLPEFDLIVCDEAHRTTGVTFAGEDQSDFVKVHDNEIIQSRKRLYMTATPRIYGENAKSKARDSKTVLASMDDPALYGEILFHYGFAQAVKNDILTDYWVIVLGMDEGQVSSAVQKRLTKSNELDLDNAAKIVGCWKALSKMGFEEKLRDDPNPMRRALAFCRSIASSKLVCNEFMQVVREFQDGSVGENGNNLSCEVQHVDGTYNARRRGKRIDWLRENAGPDVCRILSNARCLVEGVDVPALDAILFLHPRNSQIDVVQAVGRVMRTFTDKKKGYVILPIGIPPDIPTAKALDNHQKYRVVWQVLNALRTHDERLDTAINQGRLGQDISDRIMIVDTRTPPDKTELDAVTSTVDNLPSRSEPRDAGVGKGGREDSRSETAPLPLVLDDFTHAVMAKLVEKCGTRDYWEDWAKDIAEIAERHVTRITTLVQQPGSDAQSFFQDFLLELRDDLNKSITESDAIEMLAQHLITRPVFDALFEDHSFVRRNPVSAAMTEVLSVIDEARIEREAKTLEKFYGSVRQRATGITDPLARQTLIIELYEKFFRGAFPRTTEMLGIVYTPVEIVDFMIQSVGDALKSEFGQTFGSKGVHILDPFAGTGTFITRLLQSGLIATEDLEHKYRKEIHTNEIVLLAYYIAAINIETVFHSITKREDYLPYAGICLTDTFAMHESDDELAYYMKDNTDRRERQKESDIQVIIGNPPYSFGQKNQNDNAKNVAYKRLDQRIKATYAERSNATNLQNLYDSYIRAIRWGSDRVGETGIMAYVTGSGWVERTFADGLRKCLAEEFTSVHVFHLRGDIRKNMLSGNRAGEGENVFGNKSGTGIAISVFIKNSKASEQGRIYFHDIGRDLNREQKLEKINRYGSVRGIQDDSGWTKIDPNDHGDWLNQRDKSLEVYPKIGSKKNETESAIFENHLPGVVTNRDSWCVNFSRTELSKNIESTIAFYNSELARWLATSKKITSSEGGGGLSGIDDFVDADLKKIKWSRSLKKDLRKGKDLGTEDGQFVTCMYRPFTKQWTFFSRRLNESGSQMSHVFPNKELPNRVIAVTGKHARTGFSVLMADTLPNLSIIDGGQCFPFWFYEMDKGNETDLFEEEQISGYRRRHTITKYGLQKFGSAYPSEKVTYEDIFYYVYGLLHSEHYRDLFATNLIQDLPRIPCVKSVKDYRAFRNAGKRLGELHVGYESVTPHPATIDTGKKPLPKDPQSKYRVQKMKRGGGGGCGCSTVIYNDHISILNIPDAAWKYIVSGKPALDWVMTRQSIKTDKKSGITNDANRYAIETIGDPRYPLDLFLRVITVSLETIKIVNSLPELSKESFQKP